MGVKHQEPPAAPFFDMQAAVGITKHMGGLDATRQLLDLCRVKDAAEVLDVGCGIGAGPVHVAKTYGCRVVGVDLSERMVDWARLRARQAHVDSLVDVFAADVLDLPFPDNHFDVVVCESVLDFVDDKKAAIHECMRVAKPGGRIGLNEGLWLREPPAELADRVRDALGPAVPSEGEWHRLWDCSGLEDRRVRIVRVDDREEMRSRIEWIGWPWIVRAWGRALRLAVSDASLRKAMKRQFDVPREVFDYVGYGLFVGTKSAL